jgi:hypothetical protein
MKEGFEMVGKTLKSKINGALFLVEEEKVEQGKHYYIIRDISSGKVTCWGKEWFEKGLMQNLEIVSESRC